MPSLTGNAGDWNTQTFSMGAPAGQSQSSLDTLAAYLGGRGLMGSPMAKREMQRTRIPSLTTGIGTKYSQWQGAQAEKANKLYKEQADLEAQRQKMIDEFIPGTHQEQTGTKTERQQTGTEKYWSEVANLEPKIMEYLPEDPYYKFLYAPSDVNAPRGYTPYFGISDPQIYNPYEGFTNINSKYIQDLLKSNDPYAVSYNDPTDALWQSNVYPGAQTTTSLDELISYLNDPTFQKQSAYHALENFYVPSQRTAAESVRGQLESVTGMKVPTAQDYINLINANTGKYTDYYNRFSETPMEGYVPVESLLTPEGSLTDQANQWLQQRGTEITNFQQKWQPQLYQQFQTQQSKLDDLLAKEEQFKRALTTPQELERPVYGDVEVPVYTDVPNELDTSNLDAQLKSLQELLAKLGQGAPTGLGSVFQEQYREDPLWHPGAPEENFLRRLASGQLAE